MVATSKEEIKAADYRENLKGKPIMKVVTKYVNIENEEFYLITDTQDGHKYYGTIPYTNVKNGVLIKEMNGADMAIADTAADAIVERTHRIKLAKLFDKYMNIYNDRIAAVHAMIEDPAYHAIYA